MMYAPDWMVAAGVSEGAWEGRCAAMHDAEWMMVSDYFEACHRCWGAGVIAGERPSMIE